MIVRWGSHSVLLLCSLPYHLEALYIDVIDYGVKIVNVFQLHCWDKVDPMIKSHNSVHYSKLKTHLSMQNYHIRSQCYMLGQIMVSTKWAYYKKWSFASNYFIFLDSLRTFYKDLIWCANPNAHLYCWVSSYCYFL